MEWSGIYLFLVLANACICFVAIWNGVCGSGSFWTIAKQEKKRKIRIRHHSPSLSLSDARVCICCVPVFFVSRIKTLFFSLLYTFCRFLRRFRRNWTSFTIASLSTFKHKKPIPYFCGTFSFESLTQLFFSHRLFVRARSPALAPCLLAFACLYVCVCVFV